jgi:hypothetical protein
MSWSRFLGQLVSTSAGAAAGAWTTSITVNPVAGAAAGAGVKKTTEQLLQEFLPAQQEALQVIEERTRQIYSLLAGVDSRVRALQSAPWRSALLNVEDALNAPEHATEDLERARQRLYDAFASVTDNAERAFVAQLLSVVFVMLGNDKQSRRWLFKSYAPTIEAKNEMIEAVAAALPDLEYERKRWQGSVSLPISEGMVRVQRSPTEPWTKRYPELKRYFDTDTDRFVRMERIAPALTALANTTIDAMRLWTACADLGMPDVPPPGSRPQGDMDFWRRTGFGRPFDSTRTRIPTVYLSGPGTPEWGLTFQMGRESDPIRAFADTFEVVFAVSGVPEYWPVFVSGGCAELGHWQLDRALELYPSLGEDEVLEVVPPSIPDRTPWAQVRVLGGVRDQVEYKYVAFPSGRNGPPQWEGGPNHVLSWPPVGLWPDLGDGLIWTDDWQQ